MAARGDGSSIGFVPTMGYLHEGHLSLVRAARSTTDHVVLSIFVNPLQFLPGEDFQAYPRDEERDLKLAEREGVDVAFVPSVEEMYPEGRATTVTVSGITEAFEGAARPGHFDGVATVVATLFGIVSPDAAFFGQKDAQQLAVIRRMVADLSIPVDVVACPIVREHDGLALSSRNVYLSEDERPQAVALHRALTAGAEVASAGGTPEDVEGRMRETFAGFPLVAPEYAAVVDPDSFGPVTARGARLLIVAARRGKARLIDNLIVEPDA